MEPQRTCVGCRARAARAALVRVVRSGGCLAIDARGGAPGRGAWLHARRGCFDAALHKGALARALRCAPADLGIDEETNQSLWATLDALGARRRLTNGTSG